MLRTPTGMHQDFEISARLQSFSRSVPEAAYHALSIAIASIAIQIVVPCISPPIGIVLGVLGVRRSKTAIAVCGPERSTGRYVAIASLWTSRAGLWFGIAQIVLALGSILSFVLGVFGFLGQAGDTLGAACGWYDEWCGGGWYDWCGDPCGRIFPR